MATKTFSSRADAEKLAYADALAKKEYGMSFGQYWRHGGCSMVSSKPANCLVIKMKTSSNGKNEQ